MKRTQSILILLLIALSTRLGLAAPMGTAFTYQGRLSEGGNPATGIYDLQFVLWDSATDGAPLDTNTIDDASVTDGYFTSLLDFGAEVFSGDARWLELTVRTNGATDWTPLNPRQPVRPIPYAITSGKVSGVIADTQLSSNIPRLNGTNLFTGPVTVSGALTVASTNEVANLNAQFLNGSPASDFVAKAGDTMIGGLGIPPGDDVEDKSPAISLAGRAHDDFLYDGAYLKHYGFGFHPFEDPLGPPFEGINTYMSGFFGIDMFTGGAHRVRVSRGGNVGIGTTSPLDALSIVAPVTTAYRGNLSLYDATPTGHGVGGQLTFGGLFSTGSDPYTEWAGIQGGKANGTDGNFAGNLQFKTRRHGGALSTKMILDDEGNVGIGTATPYAQARMEVATDNRRILFNPTFGGVASGGMLALSRTNDKASVFFIGASAAPAYDQVLYGQGGLSEMRFASAEEGFGFYHVSDIPTAFAGTRPIAQVKIDRNGNLGIGTTTPSTPLHVHGGNAKPGRLRLETSGEGRGTYIEFKDTSAGRSIQHVIGQETSVAGGLLTGDTARCLVIAAGGASPIQFGIDDRVVMTMLPAGTSGADIGIGTKTPSAKLEVVGNLKVSGTGSSITTPVLSITGGSDVAGPFSMSTTDIPEGAVVVIDDAHPGRLKLSEQAYDKRVAGIVSGAGGVTPGLTLSQRELVEGGQNVALAGRVYALADATNGPITPGDLLTASSTPGHAMRATDNIRAQGAILGKAMSRLESGRGLVLVLVTLQ